MQSQKLSISLAADLVKFIDRYRCDRGLKARSEVIDRALRLLKQQSLESAYDEAYSEMLGEDALWDVATGDGSTDEAW
jgi:metal-responsive CopG/Arc/MetJ family transcriptional regulator